jgi:hypothetical protein
MKRAPDVAVVLALFAGNLLLAILVVVVAHFHKVPVKATFFLVWLTLSVLPVSAFYLLGNHLVPEPSRFTLELNLGLILAAAALIDLAPKYRVALLVVTCTLGTWGATGFLNRAWGLQPRNADVEGLVSYQAAQWLAHNARDERVFVSGELTGALQVWTDVRQVGGGTDQGALNPVILAANREITRSCNDDAVVAEYWLRALASPYIVMHDAKSAEYYHPYVRPEHFSHLEMAWTNGAGDKILRLPLPDVEEAVVVDMTQLSRLPAFHSTADVEFLNAYVEWSKGTRPARLRWLDNHRATIEAVLVKTNYDPGWRAKGGSTRPDPIGFLLMSLPPGEYSFELRYGASWDRWLGVAISLTTLILLLVRIRSSLIGLVAALGLLSGYMLSNTSSGMSIAEDTFRRLQPPIVLPGGIVDGVTFAAPPLFNGQIASVFGLNFGSPSDEVRVLVAEREAEIHYRSKSQINFRVPDDAPPSSEISVEVNGCRGNAFTVATQAK